MELPASFVVDGIGYEYDRGRGICRQPSYETVVYDNQYIDERYNTYGELGPRISYLRLGYLLGTLGFVPDSILDVGYGNGDFLKAASTAISVVKGYDIPPAYPIAPIQTVRDIYAESYDVVCFFDVLEHFPDPREIGNLMTKYVYVSIPFFHPELGLDWFRTWRHRRPSEHLWHFSERGLKVFFGELGYRPIGLSTFEDAIRKNDQQRKPNILSGIFEKTTEWARP
jgi:Methyltransferase domain